MYQVQTAEFSGPLDLLVRLIEQEKLDISKVSLAHVTDQYLSRVRQMERRDPEEMSDFLLIAARLLLLKSILLLPLLATSEEEGAAEEFALQVRAYQQFLAVAGIIDSFWRRGIVLYARERVPEGLVTGFQAPPRLSPAHLERAMKEFLARAARPLDSLERAKVERRVSIEQKIKELEGLIRRKTAFVFSSLTDNASSREIIIVSFLALLELLKFKRVRVKQQNLFEEIMIQPVSDF